MKWRRFKLAVTLALIAGSVVLAGWKFDTSAIFPLRASAQSPQWQPNQQSPDNRYVGAQACAQCHQSKLRDQAGTAMAHALFPSSDCQILRSRQRMSFRNGAFSYEIKQE